MCYDGHLGGLPIPIPIPIPDPHLEAGQAAQFREPPETCENRDLLWIQLLSALYPLLCRSQCRRKLTGWEEKGPWTMPGRPVNCDMSSYSTTTDTHLPGTGSWQILASCSTRALNGLYLLSLPWDPGSSPGCWTCFRFSKLSVYWMHLGESQLWVCQALPEEPCILKMYGVCVKNNNFPFRAWGDSMFLCSVVLCLLEAGGSRNLFGKSLFLQLLCLSFKHSL